MPNLRSWMALTLATMLALPVVAIAQDTTKSVHDTAMAPARKPAPPVLDFSGWIFGNYQYHTDQGTRLQNKFDVERAYLTFRMQAGDRTSIRVTSDVYANADGSHAIRAKYAYLQYDYLKNSRLLGGLSAWARVGELHTVLIDYEEQFWPRYLTQTPTEKFGYFSSADFGAATMLTMPNKFGEIYATITNGSGYSKPEADRFKDYALRLTITPLMSSGAPVIKSINLTGWASGGSQASKFATPTAPNLPIGTAVNRSAYGVFAGVKEHLITGGVEFDVSKGQRESDSSSATSPYAVADLDGHLMAVFATIHPLDLLTPGRRSRLGLVGRFDKFKPNTDQDPTQRFLLGGAQWALSSKSELALDYQELLGQNGSTAAPSKVWYAHFNVTF